MDIALAIAALRLVLANADAIGGVIAKLHRGEQPTPEEIDLVTAQRKAARDNLDEAIDEAIDKARGESA